VDTGLPYNRSKVSSEWLVWSFSKEKGLPVTVLRPATIYGPRSESCVGEIANLLAKNRMIYIGKGKSGAGLLYIDNAVAGIIQAGKSPQTIGRSYNLRDETRETWRRFIESLANGMGVRLPRWSVPASLAWAIACLSEAVYCRLGKQERPLLTRHAVYLFSRDQNFPIAKAQRDFDFRSQTTPKQAMAHTLAWVREHRAGICHSLTEVRGLHLQAGAG
jgi:nucleoside-diphosphate-sugar epimerase